MRWGDGGRVSHLQQQQKFSEGVGWWVKRVGDRGGTF